MRPRHHLLSILLCVYVSTVFADLSNVSLQRPERVKRQCGCGNQQLSCMCAQQPQLCSCNPRPCACAPSPPVTPTTCIPVCLNSCTRSCVQQYLPQQSCQNTCTMTCQQACNKYPQPTPWIAQQSNNPGAIVVQPPQNGADSNPSVITLQPSQIAQFLPQMQQQQQPQGCLPQCQQICVAVCSRNFSPTQCTQTCKNTCAQACGQLPQGIVSQGGGAPTAAVSPTVVNPQNQCIPACMPVCLPTCTQEGPQDGTSFPVINQNAPAKQSGPECLDQCLGTCIQACIGANQPATACMKGCSSECDQRCGTVQTGQVTQTPPKPVTQPQVKPQVQVPFKPAPTPVSTPQQPVTNVVQQNPSPIPQPQVNNQVPQQNSNDNPAPLEIVAHIIPDAPKSSVPLTQTGATLKNCQQVCLTICTDSCSSQNEQPVTVCRQTCPPSCVSQCTRGDQQSSGGSSAQYIQQLEQQIQALLQQQSNGIGAQVPSNGWTPESGTIPSYGSGTIPTYGSGNTPTYGSGMTPPYGLTQPSGSISSSGSPYYPVQTPSPSPVQPSSPYVPLSPSPVFGTAQQQQLCLPQCKQACEVTCVADNTPGYTCSRLCEDECRRACAAAAPVYPVRAVAGGETAVQSQTGCTSCSSACPHLCPSQQTQPQQVPIDSQLPAVPAGSSPVSQSFGSDDCRGSCSTVCMSQCSQQKQTPELCSRACNQQCTKLCRRKKAKH